MFLYGVLDVFELKSMAIILMNKIIFSADVLVTQHNGASKLIFLFSLDPRRGRLTHCTVDEGKKGPAEERERERKRSMQKHTFTHRLVTSPLVAS